MPYSPLPTHHAPAERADAPTLQHQIKLWKENEKILLLSDAMPNGVLILNQYRQVVFANKAFMVFADIDNPSEILGQRPGEVMQCINAEVEEGGCGTSLFCKKCGAVNAVLSALKGTESVQECYIRRQNGLTPLELRVWATPITLNNELYSIFAIDDIHLERENQALLKEMEKMAVTDALTGLYNRRYLYSEAEREFARSSRYQRPLALIMLDIDHFKKVNDTHGHDVGDRVLIALAQIMRKNLRKLDLLVRNGGEEFVVLMPEVNAEQAYAAAERLREDVENMSVPFDGGSVQFTISIGVTGIYDEKMEISFDTLMKQADHTMYEAKNAGRNRTKMWKSLIH